MQKEHQRYTVDISQHEIKEKKVYYIIKIHNLEGGTEKVTKLRFSEIESMHNRIADWINIFKIKLQIPQLPKKKLLFSTNQSEESILKRVEYENQKQRKELSIYFNEILGFPELYQLGVIEEMLPKVVVKTEKRGSGKSVLPIQETRWDEINMLKKSYLAKYENPSFSTSISLQQQQPQKNFKQQYLFKFEEHCVMDDYIVYTILIKDVQANRSWKFNQRYKDLKEYHRLIKKCRKFDSELPDFPEKKILCKLEDDDLKERKQQLETYLNKMFSYQDIAECEIMVFFIAKSQIDGNEIGCRSKGPSQNNLENSSLKVKSQSTITQDNEEDSVKRKITC